MSDNRTCPDCGVKSGSLHEVGCDVETCPICGGQALSCGCDIDSQEDARIPWVGVTPAALACRRFGWFAKLVNGRWVSCDTSDPDGTEDLNRLYRSTIWDADSQSYVCPSGE